VASASTEGNVSKDSLESKLKGLAEEISTDLAQLDSSQGKELLSGFVSELFLNLAKQSQQEFRRQKQAEGIAAAKAKGVRFGPARKPLPENFLECYEAWHSGQITMAQAAKNCGITRDSFRRAVDRMKENGSCTAG